MMMGVTHFSTGLHFNQVHQHLLTPRLVMTPKVKVLVELRKWGVAQISDELRAHQDESALM